MCYSAFVLSVLLIVVFFPVWAETGEFRDSGHSSLASAGSGHDQSLYAPPRPRRDRKHTDDSEY